MTIRSVAVAITFSLVLATSALAHDMGAMDPMGDHDTSPNGMSNNSAMASGHMIMTTSREQTPQDIARALEVLGTLRSALSRYRNYRVALSRGYRIFLPTVPQEVYHFTDYGAAAQEYTGNVDFSRPGSLLYVKRGDDYVLVGAMYSAPPSYTDSQLDELIPLSVAHWHEHVNICLPEGISLDDLLRGEIGAGHEAMPGTMPVSSPAATGINQRLGFMADGRFGFTGKISDASTCQAAGGHFIPLAFGWMVHVYPFSGDDLKVAFGTSIPTQEHSSQTATSVAP